MPDTVADTIAAPHDRAALLREVARLRRINAALMDAAERGPDLGGNAFALFQTAAALGNQVQERTAALTAALAELSQARQRMAAAIEAINQGIVLCDANDRIVVTNFRYREIWGALPAYPGTAFQDVVRGAAGRLLLAGVPADDADWVRFRMDRHTNPGEPFVLQFRDGTWLQVSERRVAGGGTVSLYTDITTIKRDEAHRRERELEEKSALLQATLDNISQGVSVFDSNRQLVACNTIFLRLLGIAPNATGLSAWCVLRLNEMGLGFVHSMPDPCSGRRREEYRTPDGRTIDLRCSIMPGCYCVATFTDVTERLAISQALQEANEGLERRVETRTAELIQANVEILAAKAEAEMMNLSKTKFFAAANHDLLQPLAAARVFASALSERRMAPANRELVRHALTALDSVDDMLTSLLDIAKLDAGVMPPSMCSFSVAEVMQRVGEEYGLIAAHRKLRLRVFAGGAVVRSDPQLLGRILRNLVSNALRYTNTGGVLIGHKRDAGGLLIGVWDTGIGVPANLQEEIFEEFRRLPQSTESAARGAGLGLSIVRRVSRMLGHPMVVRSHPGRGSLFGIIIPLSDELPISVQRPRGAGDAASGQNSLRARRVHLIDDEPHMRQSLSVLLTGWGMRVTGTASAAGALEACAGIPPDLIIADYQLEDGATGVEAIATLRRRWGGLPALILTADHGAEVQAEVSAAGLHLLHKPVRPARLRSLVTHMLQHVEKKEAALF